MTWKGEMFELHNYRFRTWLGPGYDSWNLSGNIYGRPDINPEAISYVSVPVGLDRINKVLTTKSGSQYKLLSPMGKEEEILDEIESVISRGRYSTF